MLTEKSFLEQYEKLSDEELYTAHKNLDEYSPDAQSALLKVVEKRGGLDVIIEKLKEKHLLVREKERIREEVRKLFSASVDVSFLKTIIKSELLSTSETEQVIQDQYDKLKLVHEDEKIKPRTMLGSLVGGISGSIIGGTLWGLQMIQMHRMFYIFIIGLALLSYGLIRFFTKQSKANVVVLISTVLSVLGALLIGELLFRVYG